MHITWTSSHICLSEIVAQSMHKMTLYTIRKSHLTGFIAWKIKWIVLNLMQGILPVTSLGHISLSIFGHMQGRRVPFILKKGQVRKITNLFLEIVFLRLKSSLNRYNESFGVCGEQHQHKNLIGLQIKCLVSDVTCHVMSCVPCHVMCHMSPTTNAISKSHRPSPCQLPDYALYAGLPRENPKKGVLSFATLLIHSLTRSLQLSGFLSPMDGTDN